MEFRGSCNLDPTPTPMAFQAKGRNSKRYHGVHDKHSYRYNLKEAKPKVLLQHRSIHLHLILFMMTFHNFKNECYAFQFANRNTPWLNSGLAKAPSRSTKFPYNNVRTITAASVSLHSVNDDDNHEDIKNFNSETSNNKQSTTCERNDFQFETQIDRRQAFSILGLGLALAASVPTVSNALDNSNGGGSTDSGIGGASTGTLEDVALGKGIWTNKNEFPFEDYDKDIILPATFASYATRFLINFDDGLSTWWDELEERFSLLNQDEKRDKLGKEFGSMAKSIQVSLDAYTKEQGFESLLSLFIKSYGQKEDALRQIGLLFAIIPPKYQPKKELEKLINDLPSTKNIGTYDSSTVSVNKDDSQFTQLLSSEYKCVYNPSKNAFTISPIITLFEVGINNEFGQNAIATPFGPISSTSLKRQRPDLSLDIYSLFGFSGAAACAMTHSLVIPFDVVKTRLQTDPEQYANLIDGVTTISKKEGFSAFTLGFQATITGYFWYGLSVYPTYSFFKWWIEHEAFTPAFAAAHLNLISLIAGSIAAVVASIGLTPAEACRIRTVAEPERYRDEGLLGTLKIISEEDPTLGWKSLYAGFPSLVTRQVIFGSVKFLAFERATEAIFATWPSLRDATITALSVSLIAGALSGALSSVVSQPADSILTYVAKNKGDDTSFGIIEGGQLMVEKEGIGSLFRGLGSRCLWASAIISGQFFLYDIFRNMLGINAEDLTQVFQVQL